jgi:hypothetical protein
LQGVEQFGELKAKEFLGVETGDTIAAIEGGQLA